MHLADPLFYAAAIPAVLIRGISKTGFGSGLGSFSLPLLLLVASPMEATAIMLPLLCMIDVMGVSKFYKNWDLSILKPCIPGAIIGTLFGYMAFSQLAQNQGYILCMIGITSTLFALSSKKSSDFATQPPSSKKGVFWSFISGFTSFVSHAGGPPIQMYLVPLNLEKIRFVATINAFFLFTNLFKTIPYFFLGQFSNEVLFASLILTPLVPIGVAIGIWMQNRISQKYFYDIVKIFMAITGVYMLISGYFLIVEN